MTTPKNAVEIYLKAAGFVGSKTINNADPKTEPVEVTDDPVARYLKAAGFHGPTKAVKPEQQRPQPPVGSKEDPVTRYLQASGFGLRHR